MITIFHGNDISSSRKSFLDLKQSTKDLVTLNPQKINLTDLTQAFEGSGLFTQSQNFYIEQLLSGKKKSKELTEIVNYIQKNAIENNIFLWESTELSKAMLTTFKNPVIKSFKLPQTLFVFLESIKPGNGKSVIKLFHQTLTNNDPDMVFFMLIRQVRLLLGLVQPASNNIDEITRISPWQRSKLQNQADAFEINELIRLYSKLFDIELGLKTGGLNTDLTTTIDLLLLEI